MAHDRYGCSWHVHLDLDDGSRECRTHVVTRNEAAAVPIWAGRDLARRGRRITRAETVRCEGDACGRAERSVA